MIKSIIQAAITLTIVAFMNYLCRWLTGDAGYLETMVNLLAVVVVQDILFGKRK